MGISWPTHKNDLSALPLITFELGGKYALVSLRLLKL